MKMNAQLDKDLKLAYLQMGRADGSLIKPFSESTVVTNPYNAKVNQGLGINALQDMNIQNVYKGAAFENHDTHVFKAPKRTINVDKATKNILNSIASGELGRYPNDYNVAFGHKKYLKHFNKPLTDMTISEVYNVQNYIHNQTKGTKFQTSAVGRYQFMGDTLPELVKYLGLDPAKTKFTPDVQDALATALLMKNTRFNKWKQGKISTKEFGKDLSYKWASIVNPFTGKGNYKGQHAPNNIVNTLNRVRSYFGVK
jgi:muramidase (phage lysozyme)